jgi:hypothetical protein
MTRFVFLALLIFVQGWPAAAQMAGENVKDCLSAVSGASSENDLKRKQIICLQASVALSDEMVGILRKGLNIKVEPKIEIPEIKVPKIELPPVTVTTQEKAMYFQTEHGLGIPSDFAKLCEKAGFTKSTLVGSAGINNPNGFLCHN